MPGLLSMKFYMPFKLFTVLIFLLPGYCGYSQTFSAYVNAGEKSMGEGDYYSATLYFQKALDFENDDNNVRYKMAEASRLFNDYYAAAYYYNQAVLNDKSNTYPLALYWLAMMNKTRGEYEVAKNLFFRYYQQHASDSNYYSIRARLEIQACEDAYQLMKDSIPVKVTSAGNTINTVYSDFAAQNINDTSLYYSSLRFEIKNPKTKKPQRFVTKILKSKSTGEKFARPVPLDAIFNPDTFHNGNSAFSSDFKLMVFSRCTPVNHSEMHCELYWSKNDKGKWSTPVRLNDSINLADFTNTQPALAANGAEGYILYFVSDRKGGLGKLDIYRAFISTSGNFSSPENLGQVINSEENDITPFFHNSSQTFYFSSDRYNGLGGYDIFKSKYSNQQFSTPGNAGYPINTSYNDLYFTLSERKQEGLLSSNRLGSLYIKSKTCCYDIYEYKFVEPPPVVRDTVKPDTIPVLAVREVPKPIEVAKQLLPLELYFHNDEPNPRTILTVTKRSYKELYDSYIALKPAYEKAFSQGLEGDAKNKALSDINKLFTETITGNYNRLERFAGLVLEELKAGKKIKIVVRGQASPLAKPGYNESLSKRRISSFLNYLKQYDNTAINMYLNKGLLSVEEVGAGESLAKQNVSDDFKDQRNSVYSPAAALERKIEVIDLKIED